MPIPDDKKRRLRPAVSAVAPKSRLLILVLVLFVAACAGVAAQQMEPAVGPGGAQSVEQATPIVPVKPPPFIGPPPLSVEQWAMPDMGLDEPDFPYLPGESRTASRSIGGVTHGWLINARRIPQPHPHLQSLAVQYERGLHYTSDAMYELVEYAGRHVAKKHPDAVVHLGNFSARGGGDIPYSFSHNSGRDADLGFFLRDPQGNSYTPPGLVSVDARGHYHGVDADGDPVVYTFDAEKNWRLVEGLIEADAARLQYIFVSNPLKRMLLREARRQRAAPDVIRKARVLLHQPGGALPHNDHFHLRIYCSEIDVRSGCKDIGRKVTGYKSHASARRQTVKAAVALLSDETLKETPPRASAPVGPDDAADRAEALNLEQGAKLRAAAVRRLGLLEATEQTGAIISALDDPDPRVRAAAARTLGQFQRGSSALAGQLQREENGQVVVEIVSALGAIADTTALDALVAELAAPRPLSLPDAAPARALDARIFVAQALIYTESEKPVPALITMLDSEQESVRRSALGALRLLTNHRLVNASSASVRDMLPGDGASAGAKPAAGDDPPISAQQMLDGGAGLSPEEISALWQKWYADHRDQKRDEWLIGGFRAAGYSVDRLSVQNVWDLCRAVADDDHLSYNAQRVLMRLSRREPASLSWSKEDANFFWRRWFERRWKRFGAPPIPAELSTLD